MLVYYFVPFIVSNRYFLFWVPNGHNSVTVQNRTHVCMNFFDHKDLGNHLLQLCPKVVKHPVCKQLFGCLISWFTFLSLMVGWHSVCGTSTADGTSHRWETKEEYVALEAGKMTGKNQSSGINTSPSVPFWEGTALGSKSVLSYR